jgi:hypothetical protein
MGRNWLYAAANALDRNRATVEPLDLAATGSVPENASLVVVAGPAEEFFDAEVEPCRSI